MDVASHGLYDGMSEQEVCDIAATVDPETPEVYLGLKRARRAPPGSFLLLATLSYIQSFLEIGTPEIDIDWRASGARSCGRSTSAAKKKLLSCDASAHYRFPLLLCSHAVACGFPDPSDLSRGLRAMKSTLRLTLPRRGNCKGRDWERRL
ncbi:uncharacterized protein LOC112347104 [Selaginella moellendorffii]|uniref:uncharacterized protein LOC112347104 n=1 Tax=Selaginella moellendorffii TaxID=88036 RepID=UPI000D1C8B42|nr:uncharacterized protein LOC112347104 [Selaginella moellendorffii]|eukprot:XP_024533210.1 uncharacterized protein LOC112347104 [Selaginella moellendorffii]